MNDVEFELFYERVFGHTMTFFKIDNLVWERYIRFDTPTVKAAVQFEEEIKKNYPTASIRYKMLKSRMKRDVYAAIITFSSEADEAEFILRECK